MTRPYLTDPFFRLGFRIAWYMLVVGYGMGVGAPAFSFAPDPCHREGLQPPSIRKAMRLCPFGEGLVAAPPPNGGRLLANCRGLFTTAATIAASRSDPRAIRLATEETVAIPVDFARGKG